MFHIFTGIEVLFFWLGAITLACVQGLVWMRLKQQSSWLSLAVLGTGVGTILFATAWSISSILEKEPQSASMGMVVIGLPGLVIAVIGTRMMYKAS